MTVHGTGMSTQFPQKFGKYILLRKIAMGGMAEIFRAKTVGAEGFEKDIVIKRILPHYTEDEDFVKMFIDEATIAAKLQHANITQIFDFNVEDGRYYIAMEYVEGKDLKKVMEVGVKKSSPLSPAQCAWLIMEVAKGLHYAHTKSHKGKPLNIVHRDISPQNAMVSFNGEVKLMDFGIAKAASRSTKTVAGTVKGKCAYMSPEQARGKPLDGRSDLFALGVVLWEMLTHKRLFLGDSDFVTLSNVLKQEAPAPSTLNPAVPPELDAIVLKSLAKDRDDRQETVEHFHRELTKWFYASVEDLDAAALKPWMSEMFSDEISELQQQMQEERTMAISVTDDVPAPSANDATVALPLGDDPHGAKTVLDDSELNAEKVRQALAAAQAAQQPGMQSTGAMGAMATGTHVQASGKGKGVLIGLLVFLLIGGGGFAAWYFLAGAGAGTAKAPKSAQVKDDSSKKKGTNTKKEGDTKKKPNPIQDDTAELTLTIEPSDAKNVIVFKNGAPEGKKLTDLAMNEKIMIKVTADGFEPYEKVVEIKKQKQGHTVKLKKAVKTITLVVKTNDKKAIILANGKPTGADGVASVSGPAGSKLSLEVKPSAGGEAIKKVVTLTEGMPLVELNVPGLEAPAGGGAQLATLLVKCSKTGAKVESAPVGHVEPQGDGTSLVKKLVVGSQVKITCRSGQSSGSQQVTVAQAEQTVEIPMKAATKPVVRKGPCTISINARPYAKCTVGGKGPKTTKFTVTLTGPKRYTVSCTKGTQRKSKGVKCKPGKTSSVFFDMQ